jgi:uncharacterized protein (DUF952 family)
VDSQPIYHLVPADYYRAQAQDQPYLPKTFAEEGFIHCTSGIETLLDIANLYFSELSDDLLALKIDPDLLTSSLKFELPNPPTGSTLADNHPARRDPNLRFPHIYGPLNREAIVDCVSLRRSKTRQWQVSE